MIDLKKLLENSKIVQPTFTNKDERVLIIDGLNTWLRVVSSISIINDNGVYIGGIVGFLRSIASNIREFNPSRCIIVFDGKGGSLRRKKLYPDYKSNRTGKFKPKRPEGYELTEEEERANLTWQLQRTLMYLENLPVQVVCVDHVEADDVIAYTCKQYFVNHSNKIRILSTDRDFLQLVSDQIEVYSPVKKKLYTPVTLEQELGIKAENYLLYRTLTGDVSDNIKGVDGLALKTILKYFPDIAKETVTYEYLFEHSLQNVENIKKPKQAYKTVLDSKPVLDINHQLMQLSDTDISGHVKLQILETIDGEINKINKPKFKQMLIEDCLNTTFKDPDMWIYNSFNRLNVWATR